MRKRNKWLTQRLHEQSDLFKNGINQKMFAMKERKADVANKSLSNMILKWYYAMSDQIEKITVSSFKNMIRPTFQESLNYVLR